MIPPPRLTRSAAIALSSGLLFLGVCGKNTAIGASPALVPAKSAETTSFDEVTARLDRGGSFYFYLSAEQWLSQLSQHVADFRELLISAVPEGQDDASRQKVAQGFNLLNTFIKKSGIEQITGVGASSIALEPGVYRNTFFLHHYKEKETGVLNTLFGAAPHTQTALDFLPADTAVASYADFDAAQLLTMIRDTLQQSGIPEVKQAVDMGLAQFAAVAAMPMDAALQSLGGSEGIVLTLDPAKPIEVSMGAQKQMIPTPRLALLIQTKDDRIFQRLDQVSGGQPGIVKTDEPDLKMRTMSFPALPQFTVRPTVAQWGNFLVIASDDSLIRDMIAAQKTGQGFKATPAFAKLSAGMPAEGNGFSLVTQTFVDTWKHVQTDMMTSQPNTPPAQAEMMKKMMAWQGTGTAYTVSAHVENGWLSVGKGTQSLDKTVVPLMTVVPIAIAAGAALPVFNSVQQKAKATKSLSQAKQIGLACKLYAADHKGKFPPKLDALFPEYLQNKALLASPFAPDEPMGYTYKTGLSEKSPNATVLLEDKFSAKEQQRVVIHVDISGEITKLPKE